MVNDIDNDGELAGIGAIVDHDNTADLNDTLESGNALFEGGHPEGKDRRKEDSVVRIIELVCSQISQRWSVFDPDISPVVAMSV